MIQIIKIVLTRCQVQVRTTPSPGCSARRWVQSGGSAGGLARSCGETEGRRPALGARGGVAGRKEKWNLVG